MNNGKSKFFCENCGAEVPEKARMCKSCGKFFISVRCPKCFATGSSKDFENGCPECGYAVPNKKNAGTQTSYEGNGTAVALGKLFARAHSQVHGYRSAKTEHDSSLPLWVYVLTASVLLGVMLAVYSCIKSPVYY